MKTLSQIREASGGKEAYQKFVNTMLKKFGVKSPAELEGDKKKKFYDALDAGWEGKDEKPEAGDKKESAVTENCGGDHSGKGKCPECGKQLTEGKLDGIAKALTSLASKPEYKKVAKNLKSLAMRASEGDKKAAKQVATQLDKLIMKVGKKEAKKLMSIADLAMTYEEVELTEKVSLSKKGDYEMTVDGKSSVGIRLSLRYKGKQIVTGTKVDGKFVMAFEPIDGNNKLPKGAKEVKKGKYVHIAFAKVDDVIAYAKFGDITEAVSVDSRTKGYKEAVKRGIILAQKREAKKAKLEAQRLKDVEEEIANATGVAISNPEKPLGKVKKRMSFKDFK